MVQKAGSEHGPEEQLAQLLRMLWRAVAQTTRAVEHLPTLPEAKVVLLRKLLTAGPLAPAALAARLGLARSTVSNLVRELDADGLLERRPSESDGRSVLLVPTEQAKHVLEAFGRGRIEVVEQAMGELPAADRRRIVAAVPSLHKLLEQLQAAGGPDRPDGGEPNPSPSGPAPTNVPP
jgi:DNA-binding MarR family transcriptional regulator